MGQGGMRISVFGLGYVGTVTAACLADKGHRVVGVEVNPEKLTLFQCGKSPIFEPHLAPLLEKAHRLGRFIATTDVEEAIASSNISFICVGTPSRKGGQPDTSHVEHVAYEIGGALRGKKDMHTVAVRSTMLPGSVESLVIPRIEEASGRAAGRALRVVANPEFMREGFAIKDFYQPPFVIIGERAPGEGDTVAEAYRFVDAPHVRTSIGIAEAIKFACNAFHALKVTFANELGHFCKAHGIDSHEVMEVFCQDAKLNLSASYLSPGLAFGGSCLPKDLRALVSRAREAQLDLPMLEAVARSNSQQIQRTVDLIAELGHREVGILGLSFKAGTDDLRESPVVSIAETLIGKGFKLAIHDSEIELTRLTGANKRFLEDKLPHISCLLARSVAGVVRRSRTLVICKRAAEYANLESVIHPDQQIVDLVAMLRTNGRRGNHYHGLYW
jgi:GDP-mannose 6-dehydrogenase